MKIPPCLLMAALCLHLSPALAQEHPSFADSAAVYFREIKTALQQHRDAWDQPLYGPLLLVEPHSRRLYANYPDTAELLQPTGPVYTGTLPAKMNMANTAVEWGGRRWAMVLLPLAADPQYRVNVLAHELFHRAQPSLGFDMKDPANNHLDEKEGRIYLRLELAALQGALHAAAGSDRKTHLAHALTFRKYRHRLYAGADTLENQLELNEGLAEYTGQLCSSRGHRQTVIHIDSTLQNFLSNPTFIRSFAYQTIPIYGYLLQGSRKNWQHDITATTNLTDYFIQAFSLSLPADPETAAAGIADRYNGPAIMAAETERAVKKRALVAAYKARFIEQPHLEIRLEKMNISFNPGNIMPLEDKGTVYPNMRVSDRWGILEVQQGALMAPDWDKISLSAPEKITGNQASGEGWTLQLNDGWQIIKDPAATGNYLLTRQ